MPNHLPWTSRLLERGSPTALIWATRPKPSIYMHNQAPVSIIKEPSTGFHFSSSPRLLAYVYDESWEGKREVQVRGHMFVHVCTRQMQKAGPAHWGLSRFARASWLHSTHPPIPAQVTHKSSSYSNMNLPTSILFLPVAELEGLQAGLAKEGFDWRLAPGSSLEARIDLLLR